MPSRKQRRRREKLHRHEYEWVVETEEGEEVPLDRPTERAPRDGKGKDPSAPRDRRGREVPKPSLGRVVRRSAIFAPLILVFVWITSPGEATAAKITTGVILLAFFIPFSYLVDVLMYRTLSRRQQRARERRD